MAPQLFLEPWRTGDFDHGNDLNWEAPRNRLSPRHHSAEKQLAIRTQIIKLLELGVIKELQANTYRRWSMAIDPRLAHLNAVTQVPDCY